MPIPLAAAAVGTAARAGIARMGQSFLGRHLLRGAGEAFGVQYSKAGVSRGFMGLGKKPLQTALRMPGAFYKTARKRGMDAAMSKVGMKFAGRALAPGIAAFQIYQGYQEEGIYGAAKAGAEAVLFQTAFNVGKAVLGSGAMWMGAGVAAAGYGYYKFGEAAQEHRKRIRGLEFASTSMDMVNSAGALTHRAAAVRQLEMSPLNARIALGNEAMLTHTSYR